MSGQDQKERDKAIEEELNDVKKEVPSIPDCKLIAAVQELVRVEIYKTEQKQLALICIFPPTYPKVSVATELNSKTMNYKFLSGLAKKCDAEAAKMVGKKQVVEMVKFVKTFLEENPLCVCSDEIVAVKRLMTGEADEVKLRQKQSQVTLKITQNSYFLNLKVTVPDDYPKQQVIPEITEHNFPEFLKVNFQAQAVEIARQCVTAPLKKKPKDPPFAIKPSFQPVCDYIISQCVKNFPTQSCPLCQEKVLPPDPSDPSAVRGKKRVEKVYCGHLYHLFCLNKYMKTPPFSGGKMCPACGKQIFHEKWKTTPHVMEQRWAHKQAKQRELDEVVDFMQ